MIEKRSCLMVSVLLVTVNGIAIGQRLSVACLSDTLSRKPGEPINVTVKLKNVDSREVQKVSLSARVDKPEIGATWLLRNGVTELDKRTIQKSIGKLNAGDSVTVLLQWHYSPMVSSNNVEIALVVNEDDRVFSKYALQYALPVSETLGAEAGEEMDPPQEKNDFVSLDTTLTGHTDKVNCVVFKSNGDLLGSASSDETIKLWRVQGTTLSLKGTLQDETGVKRISFAPDGQTIVSLASSLLDPVKIWSVGAGVVSRKLMENVRRTKNGTAFSPDGRVLACGIADWTIAVLDMETGFEIKRMEGHQDDVTSVIFDNDGRRLISGSEDKSVRFWSMPAGEPLGTLSGHTDDVLCLALSPDGKSLATGSADKTILIWSLDDKAVRRKLVGHGGDIYSLSFSPDGSTLASGGEYDSVFLWSTDEGKLLTKFSAHHAGVLSVCFSPGGELLVSGGADSTIKVWKVKQTPRKQDLSSRHLVGDDSSGISILVTTPPIQRGMKVIHHQDAVTIKGVVTSENSIQKMLINKREVNIGAGGEFSAMVALTYGDNVVTIKAVDAMLNIAEMTFVVTRETQTTVIPKQGKNFALLIATDQYDAWPRLVNPTNDANSVAKELGDAYGFQTQVIGNPTQADILSSLRRYAEKRYAQSDQLFIFLAGHGQFDEVLGDGYIVAKDSKLRDDVKTSYIPHSTLRTIINNIPCKHIFLVVDACFGGTFDPLIAANDRGDAEYAQATKAEFIQRKLRFKTRRFLTSGGREYVSDGRPGEHSPFTRKLLEALRSYGGRDGILTIGEILGYVEKVKPEPRTGEFGNNEPGSDFIFMAR